MSTKFWTKLKSLWLEFKNSDELNGPLYRITEIFEDENNEFVARIQLKNKNEVIKMKPEEILRNDELTNSFSGTDVRTLTYLGYLGINTPKYKILAKSLSQNDSKMIFAIKEKGKKDPIIKTANEISKDKDFIKQLNQADAHNIGFTTGTEFTEYESKILKEQNNKQSLPKDEL